MNIFRRLDLYKNFFNVLQPGSSLSKLLMWSTAFLLISHLFHHNLFQVLATFFTARVFLVGIVSLLLYHFTCSVWFLDISVEGSWQLIDLTGTFTATCFIYSMKSITISYVPFHTLHSMVHKLVTFLPMVHLK